MQRFLVPALIVLFFLSLAFGYLYFSKCGSAPQSVIAVDSTPVPVKKPKIKRVLVKQEQKIGNPQLSEINKTLQTGFSDVKLEISGVKKEVSELRDNLSGFKKEISRNFGKVVDGLDRVQAEVVNLRDAWNKVLVPRHREKKPIVQAWCGDGWKE